MLLLPNHLQAQMMLRDLDDAGECLCRELLFPVFKAHGSKLNVM